MNIDNFNKIKSDLNPYDATLVAVSKTKPQADILTLFQNGHLDFGENRVQELVDKAAALPKEIHWHMIGHLQTNKVKYIAPFVYLIHSVDSFKVLKEINKQAQRYERQIRCLLQFKIAAEDTKYGFDKVSVVEMLEAPAFKSMENIEIVGVMGMATFTNDHVQVRNEFGKLKQLFDFLKKDYFSHQDSFKEISMGMSGDYPIALEEGSTMVRVGSMIFGARN